MRTFTYNELKFKHYPHESDFRDLLEHAQAQLTAISEHIACAIAYGSTVIGKPNVTSDFDFVVILNADTMSQTRSALQSISKLAHNLWIPIDGPTVYTVGENKRDHHTITPGFARHLQFAASKKGLLAGDITALKSVPISNMDDLQQYLIRKLKKIRELQVNLITHKNIYDLEHITARAEVLNTWKYATLRFIEAKGINADKRSNWEKLLPAEARPLYVTLSASRERHMDAIAFQVDHLYDHAWKTEVLALDQLLPELETLLSILERNLT